MNQDGWVKLHRILADHPIATQCSLATFKVWIMCLMRANRRPSSWYDGEKQIEVPVGSFICGQEKFAATSGISRQQLRTAFSNLQNLRCITIKATNKHSMVVIENWNSYQNDVDDGNQQTNQLITSRATNEQPTTNQRVTTEGELRSKKGEEENTIPAVNGKAPILEWEMVMHDVAKRMHDRHPVNRRCGITEIEKCLRTIMRKVKVAEKTTRLLDIEKNHVAMCAIDDWTKAGGQYAMGLAKWLSPSIARFDERPSENLFCGPHPNEVI